MGLNRGVGPYWRVGASIRAGIDKHRRCAVLSLSRHRRGTDLTGTDKRQGFRSRHPSGHIEQQASHLARRRAVLHLSSASASHHRHQRSESIGDRHVASHTGSQGVSNGVGHERQMASDALDHAQRQGVHVGAAIQGSTLGLLR